MGVPGQEDYPQTLAELESRFSSEQACREYLFGLRWPEGFRCVRCGGSKAWPLRSGRWQCAACGYQISTTAGTIFQDTRTPLTIWFRSIWWMTCQKNGISALGLQRVLGLGQLSDGLDLPAQAALRDDSAQQGAAVGHRRGGRSLAGRPGKRGSRTADPNQSPDRRCRRGGRRRDRSRPPTAIPDASSHSLLGFIQQSVEAGELVHTDGWPGYFPLAANGYPHKTTVVRTQQAVCLRPAAAGSSRGAAAQTMAAGHSPGSRAPGASGSLPGGVYVPASTGASRAAEANSSIASVNKLLP